MAIYKVTEARNNLYGIVDEVVSSHTPVTITGKKGNAVLLSEDDWFAIQETLHIVSIPGMKQSIQEGLATDLEDCSKDLEW